VRLSCRCLQAPLVGSAALRSSADDYQPMLPKFLRQSGQSHVVRDHVVRYQHVLPGLPPQFAV